MSTHDRKRMKKIREQVINRDGMICCYCNKLLTHESLTLDHIIPDSKKGVFNLTNLTPACHTCNNRRGNMPFFEYCILFNFSVKKLLKYKRLYNNNIKIKIINIAKESCLVAQKAIPNELIKEACELLNVDVSIDDFQNRIEINLNELCDRKKIKFWFENIIKMINGDLK